MRTHTAPAAPTATFVVRGINLDTRRNWKLTVAAGDRNAARDAAYARKRGVRILIDSITEVTG